MTPEDLYDDLAIQFPLLWPQSPHWSWVNVHDGRGPKVQAISELLAKTISSSEVIVLVRSSPGIAVQMPRTEAAEYVAQFVLRHEVQIGDQGLTRFVSVATSGVATVDA